MKKIISTILTLIFLVSFMTISLGESYVMHTVNQGDTYWKLSNNYGQNLNNILAINQTTGDSLATGDFIKVMSLNTDIKIFVDNIKLSPDVSPYLESNRTFVPIRFISEALNVDIQWDTSSSSAIITNGNNKITLPVGSKTAYVNGTAYYIDAPIKLYQDRVFVPLRFVSEVLNCSVEWNQQDYAVTIRTGQNQSSALTASKAYSEEDLYWLSRIVSAESSGEPYEGKLAVANVIINRKKDSAFPNTIKGVIFDNKFGYQFTPVISGSINNTPTSDSIRAAKEALEGKNNIGNALYFVNASKSTLNWIQSNRTYYKTIANHDFYL